MTLRNNEIDGLENRVVVEICEDINFNVIKEVALPRDQFCVAAAIGSCTQGVKRAPGYHTGIPSMDYQHTVEYDPIQVVPFHNPDLH